MVWNYEQIEIFFSIRNYVFLKEGGSNKVFCSTVFCFQQKL